MDDETKALIFNELYAEETMESIVLSGRCRPASDCFFPVIFSVSEKEEARNEAIPHPVIARNEAIQKKEEIMYPVIFSASEKEEARNEAIRKKNSKRQCQQATPLGNRNRRRRIFGKHKLGIGDNVACIHSAVQRLPQLFKHETNAVRHEESFGSRQY